MGAVAGPLVGAGITAGVSLFGASKQAESANRGSEAQLQAQREALAFSRQQWEEEKRRYEEEQARLDAAWAADQARRAPFRNAALNVLGDYGFRIPESAWQTPERPMGWEPGESRYSPPPSGIDSTGFGLVRRRTPSASPSSYVQRYG